jgi:hypothetical protein
MPDELSEQTAETPPEQTTDVVVEQTQAAAPTDSEGAVAEGEGAAPDPVVQFQSDEDVRAFLEANDRARSYLEKAKNDGFEAGRQNKDAEIRRLAASDEVIADRLKSIALEAGWDASDERLKRAVVGFHEPATKRTQLELSRLYIEGAKSVLSPDAQAAIDEAVRLAGEDVEAHNSIVGQLWQHYGDSSREDAVSGLTLEQVPPTSKLFQEIEERVAREVETELKARDTEANRIDPGPRTTQGSAPVGPLTLEKLKTMPRSEVMALDKDEVNRVMAGR